MVEATTFAPLRQSLASRLLAAPALFAAPLLLAGLLGGCAGESEDDELGEDEAAASATCSGDGCASLAVPAPLASGGIAIWNDRLAWLTTGGTLGGRPVFVLATCALPACTTVTKQPLVTNGVAIGVSARLKAVPNGFLVVGTTAPYARSAFLSDGVALHTVLDGTIDDDAKYVVAPDGILLYAPKGTPRPRSEASFTWCAFQQPGQAATCKRKVSPSLEGKTEFAVTPTRAIAGAPGTVLSFDRATLANERAVESWTEQRRGFISAGETVLALGMESRGSGTNSTDHTVLEREDEGRLITLPGTLTVDTNDGTNLYVGTVSSLDRFRPTIAGVVARYKPGQTRATTLARAQRPHGIALGGANVYWLDISREDLGENPVGVVRFTKR